MMAYLDLNTLPRTLRKVLDQHFDNDESKRRAVLAPSVGHCESIIGNGLWAWSPLRYFWRRKRARLIRESREKFFKLVVNDREPGSPSIFAPDQPFFPTPLTKVTVEVRSPYPDVLSDAEFWAFMMQLHMGNEAVAANQLRGWANNDLRAALNRRGLQRLCFWKSKAAVIRNMVWKMSAANRGDYL
jgi:hypothetical protein